MAKFTFQLEGVLTHRENIERERQREVATLQGQLAAQELELRKLDQSVQQSNLEVRLNHLTGPLDMSFLTAHRRFLNSSQNQAVAIAQKMVVIQQKIEVARKSLLEAAKQRKIVEKLREKQFERWKIENTRKEMLAADEASTQFSFAQSRDDEISQEENISRDESGITV